MRSRRSSRREQRAGTGSSLWLSSVSAHIGAQKRMKRTLLTLWLTLHAGLALADPSSNAPAIQAGTNGPIDFRFLEHYLAAGTLRVGGSALFPNLPKIGMHGHFYHCKSFGLESIVHVYHNMVLVRITIPGAQRTALQSELSKRYGAPAKRTDGTLSWDVLADGERRLVTLHRNAVLESTANGKKQPLPDEALLEIARMKSEHDKQRSSASDEVEFSVTSEPASAPSTGGTSQ